MGNISVNITELKQLLKAVPATHNIMLVGNHGIGKSEILTESPEWHSARVTGWRKKSINKNQSTRRA